MEHNYDINIEDQFGYLISSPLHGERSETQVNMSVPVDWLKPVHSKVSAFSVTLVQVPWLLLSRSTIW